MNAKTNFPQIRVIFLRRFKVKNDYNLKANLQKSEHKKKTQSYLRMPVSYEKNKIHIYKYRLSHLDKVRRIDNNWKKNRYHWKKIQKVFFCILLD